MSVPDSRVIRSSYKALEVTSDNFLSLREEIERLYDERMEISKKISKNRSLLGRWTFFSIVSKLLIFGFFYHGIDNNRKKFKKELMDLEQDLEKKYVDLKFAQNNQIEKGWLDCLDTFLDLVKCAKIWDVTYSEQIDRVRERSYASSGITRKEIIFEQKSIDFIRTDIPPLYLFNQNGPDLYLFPRFLILLKSKERFGIFALDEIDVEFSLTKFVEEENVPRDSEVIDSTWAKVNKNGSRDKRFKNNYEIPIVKYGTIEIKSTTGIDESYMFSDIEKLLDFEMAYTRYTSLL